MPIYEYSCAACGERFEVLQKFSDAPIETCQLCGKGPVRKVLHPVAIHFKGSGFYTTDYARKSSSHPSSDKSADKGGDGTAENVKMNPDGETATFKMSEKAKSENRKARAEKKAAAAKKD